MTTTTKHTIEARNIAKFNVVLARANKKAAKLGVEPFVATFSPEYGVPVMNKGVVVGRRVMVDITLTGATPSLKGWTLTGVIAPLQADNGSILPLVTTVPGETVSDAARNTDNWERCDHCNTRRTRHETFIVRHEDGTEKQVGRNCVADFLGGADKNSAHGLAALAGLRIAIDSEVKGFGASSASLLAYDLRTVLATTVRVMATRGWVSVGMSQRSGGIPTREFVAGAVELQAILNRTEDVDGKHDSIKASWKESVPYLPTDADYTEADGLMEALGVSLDAEMEKGEMSDYLRTVQTIFFARAVNPRSMGIACSMVNVARKAMGMETGSPALNKLLAAKATSQFVGVVAKRQTFKVTVCDIIRGDSWNIKVLVTEDGNILKTFSALAANIGDSMVIKATPTKHSEYKGVKETVVNRVAMV